jgi:hypothetical protein
MKRRSRGIRIPAAVPAAPLLAKLSGLDVHLTIARDCGLKLRPRVRVRKLGDGRCSATFRWTGPEWSQSVVVHFSPALLIGLSGA